MKQKQVCPKCNHTNILYCKGEAHSETGDNSIVFGLFSVVPIDRYVCCSCGYVEDWVDTQYLETLKKQYRKDRKKKEKALQ